MADVDLVELIRRICGWCESVFGVCPRCFRGQRYCSSGCREKAEAQQHREDQAKYQRTDKGRQKRAERERLCRERQKFPGVAEGASCATQPPVSTLPFGDVEHDVAEPGRAGDAGPTGAREDDRRGHIGPETTRAAPPPAPSCIVCHRPGFFGDPDPGAPATGGRPERPQAPVRPSGARALPVVARHAEPDQSSRPPPGPRTLRAGNPPDRRRCRPPAGTARRAFRGPQRPALPRVRALAYFQPLVTEVLEDSRDPDHEYLAYLLGKLRPLAEIKAARLRHQTMNPDTG